MLVILSFVKLIVGVKILFIIGGFDIRVFIFIIFFGNDVVLCFIGGDVCKYRFRNEKDLENVFDFKSEN